MKYVIPITLLSYLLINWNEGQPANQLAADEVKMCDTYDFISGEASFCGITDKKQKKQFKYVITYNSNNQVSNIKAKYSKTFVSASVEKVQDVLVYHNRTKLNRGYYYRTDSSFFPGSFGVKKICRYSSNHKLLFTNVYLFSKKDGNVLLENFLLKKEIDILALIALDTEASAISAFLANDSKSRQTTQVSSVHAIKEFYQFVLQYH